jgi:hypothetical protein
MSLSASRFSARDGAFVPEELCADAGVATLNQRAEATPRTSHKFFPILMLTFAGTLSAATASVNNGDSRVRAP